MKNSTDLGVFSTEAQGRGAEILHILGESNSIIALFI